MKFRLYLKYMKFKILIILFLFSSNSIANELVLELGKPRTNFNYFQKPNNNENRVDLESNKNSTSLRLSFKYNLNKNWQLYLLYAPLKLNYEFISKKDFNYNNSNFQKNKTTNVSYKFNSYRIGFLRNYKKENFKWWYGFVGKIRDAEIKVSQANKSDSFDNVGFVPLLSLGIEYYLSKKISLYSQLDGLAAPQGSAYDFNIDFRYKIQNHSSISIGNRTLGGGADNDSLKNFANFNTYYLSYIFSF